MTAGAAEISRYNDTVFRTERILLYTRLRRKQYDYARQSGTKRRLV